MVEIPKCTNWLGHKFEGRYSTSNPGMERLMERGQDIEISARGMEAMKRYEYACDICVRCGFKVIQ